MESCPRCGYADDSLPGYDIEIRGQIDVAVRRLGDVAFDQPIRLTRFGAYVVGHNEDGQAILTRLPGAEDVGRKGTGSYGRD